MRFATRAFLSSFLPVAVLLAVCFWAIRTEVIATVRDGLRASVRDNQIAFTTVRTPLIRAAIALLFAVPAAVAGYHGALGLAQKIVSQYGQSAWSLRAQKLIFYVQQGIPTFGNTSE